MGDRHDFDTTGDSMTSFPPHRQHGAGMSPPPHQVRSWQDAEVNAANWMRHWGYADAEPTPGGADGGIDVRSSGALAQVKYLAAAVGRPDLQRLAGAATIARGCQLLFFTGSDYSAAAVEYADMVGMALFRYGLDGSMTAVNQAAQRVMALPMQHVGGASERPVQVRQPVASPDWKWRWKHGGWYLGVPLLSAGAFAAVPFWHAHARLQRPELRSRAVTYSVTGVVLLALAGIAPTDAQGDPVGLLGRAIQVIVVVGALVIMLSACVTLAAVRREIFSRPGWSSVPQEPHVAHVLAARARRQAARELRQKDPDMARELGIGRPDLGRGYDDGGLVDLNSAPAAVIESVCGLSSVQAEAIIAARSSRGGTFYGIGEILMDVPLTESDQNEIRERGLV